MTTTRHAYGIRRTVLYVVSCDLLTQHNQENARMSPDPFPFVGGVWGRDYTKGGSDKVEMSHDIPRQHARGIRDLTHAILTPHIHSDSSVEVLLLLSLLATATIHGMLQYMFTRFH